MGLTARSAAIALVSLMTAAACLAAPALARADGAPDTESAIPDAADTTGTSGGASTTAVPATATSPTDAEDAGAGAGPESSSPAGTAAVEDGTAYAFGGIQATLPEGFDVVDLGSMMLASNADASVIVSAVPSATGTSVPASPGERSAFFAPFAQATADETGATLTDGGPVALADRTEAYLFTLEFVKDGTDVRAAQYYIPLADGSFTLAQITVSASDAEASALGDAIAQTLALATDDAVQLGTGSEGAAPARRTEVGGIAFDLPEGYTDTTLEGGDPTWYSADGTVMLAVLPVLVDDIDELGTDTYGLIVDGIVTSLGGTVEGNATLANADAEVRVYMFTFESDSEMFVGALGMVPLPDASVTGILALAPMSNSSEIDALVATVFNSIALAA